MVSNKEVENYAVEVAKRAVECLGYRRFIVRSDSELAVLVIKEAVRTKTDVERCARGGAHRGPSGERLGRERGEERTGTVPGDQGRTGVQAQDKN